MANCPSVSQRTHEFRRKKIKTQFELEISKNDKDYENFFTKNLNEPDRKLHGAKGDEKELELLERDFWKCSIEAEFMGKR